MNLYFARFTLLFALITLSSIALAQAEPSEEMEKDVRKMLVVTGVGEMGVQVVNQLLSSFKQSVPQVPEEFWTRFASKVDGDGLIELVIPIYAKHFTHDEIKELLAFYETPIGKKLISTQPAMLQESMAVGQTWGESLADQVMQELAAEGHSLPGRK